MAKHIVVTGATRGLGRALTERFINAGHTVLGCGRSTNGVEDLRARYGEPHDFDTLNVANGPGGGSVGAALDRALRPAGPADQQRRDHQPQRPALGDLRGGVRHRHRREH